MKLRQCVMCRKPMWDDRLNTTNAEFGPHYCQCPTLTIHLTATDYMSEVLKSLSRQLTPEKTAVPPGIYNAFTDEEVQL